MGLACFKFSDKTKNAEITKFSWLKVHSLETDYIIKFFCRIPTSTITAISWPAPVSFTPVFLHRTAPFFAAWLFWIDNLYCRNFENYKLEKVLSTVNRRNNMDNRNNKLSLVSQSHIMFSFCDDLPSFVHVIMFPYDDPSS